MKTLPLLLSTLFLAFPALAEEKAHPIPPADKAMPEGSIYVLDSTWTDQDGKEIKWSESKGSPRVIALGYATCQGICPRIIADMQRIEKAMPEDSKVRYTFITLDPKNDDQSALKALSERHKLSKNWDVIRADEDALLEMAVVLGVRFDRLPNGVDFAHSYLIASVGADGKILHKWINAKDDPEASVKALKGM